MILLPFLIVIGCVAVWFLAAFLYKPIGKFINRIWGDVKETITDESEEEKIGKE